MSNPIPAPMSLAAHEPERVRLPDLVKVDEERDRVMMSGEHYAYLLARIADAESARDALRDLAAERLRVMSDAVNEACRLEQRLESAQRVSAGLRAELERLTRMLERFVRESYMAGEAREKCEACEGSGLDVDHARRLYTDEWGDPVGDTEFMSVAEIAALYRDDFGDEPAACTAEGCFEGRYIA